MNVKSNWGEKTVKYLSIRKYETPEVKIFGLYIFQASIGTLEKYITNSYTHNISHRQFFIGSIIIIFWSFEFSLIFSLVKTRKIYYSKNFCTRCMHKFQNYYIFPRIFYWVCTIRKDQMEDLGTHFRSVEVWTTYYSSRVLKGGSSLIGKSST